MSQKSNEKIGKKWRKMKKLCRSGIKISLKYMLSSRSGGGHQRLRLKNASQRSRAESRRRRWTSGRQENLQKRKQVRRKEIERTNNQQASCKVEFSEILPWWVRIKSPMWQNLKNFQKFLSYDHNSISFGKTKARAFFWVFSHWFWTIFHHFTTFWKKSLFWIYDSLAIWVKLEMRMSKT